MNLDAYGYEVLIQPALYAAAVIAVCVALLKGAGRRDGKLRLARGAGRRAGLVLAVAALIVPAVVVTPPGHRAAIYNLSGGVSPIERGEGVSLIIPYAETARMVNVRTRVFTDGEVYAQSSDLQEITVQIAVNYHVDPDLAAELYQRVGLDYEKTIIRPAVLQLVKQEVGLVKAADFAINREPLARAIESELTAQLAGFGVTVEYVNIEDAIFDPDFIRAVKEKVVADEIADKEQRLVAAETARKQQQIIQAEAVEQRKLIEARGESAAIETIAAALGFTPDQYLQWLLIGRWTGDLPQTLLGDPGEFGVLLTP